MQILSILAENPKGLSLGRLRDILRLPKTSVLSLLRSLESGAYLTATSGVYQLGPAAHRLSLAIQRTAPFPNCARASLERLADETKETAVIGVLSDDRREVVYVDVIETPNALRYSVQPGARRPLYASAIGQVVLAYMSPEERQHYLQSTVFTKLTPQTPSNVGEIAELIGTVIQEGISLSHSGMVEGVSGMAAPLFDCNGMIFGGIAASAPSARLAGKQEVVRRALLAAGREVSQVLGFRGDSPHD
jgi:DNA-binding IclR family transcriptional regulator